MCGLGWGGRDEKIMGMEWGYFFTCVDPDKKGEENFMGFGWEHCMWMG